MYSWCNNNDSYLRTLIKFTHSKTKSLLKTLGLSLGQVEGKSSDNVFYMMPQAFILFVT